MKKIIITFALLLMVNSCTGKNYLKTYEVQDALNRNKSVIIFGFSQGDQVINAAYLRIKESSKVVENKLSSKKAPLGGAFDSEIFKINLGNYIDRWTLFEKHRSFLDAKIGKTEFYYPRYSILEINPGKYKFNIRALYDGNTVSENYGEFTIKKGEVAYVGSIYLTDQLKYEKDSVDLNKFNFPIEKNGFITKQPKSLNFTILDTKNHLLELLHDNPSFPTVKKRIAEGNFYKNKKFIAKYPIN